MLYSKQGKFISIEINDIWFGGKRPALYVGEGNSFVKVGTFSNEKSAKRFEEMLQFMFGEMLVKMKEGDSA